MEYYFDPDDRLDRRKYAEFLKSMLENCDKYRREDSDGAYVIAIDSPWGTGKTRFAKMLRNYLEGRDPKIVSEKVDQSFIPPAKEDRKFNVIYYNSWETDYWNDAIEPLVNNIINSDVLKEFREDARNKEQWNQFKEFARDVLEASADLAAGHSVWGTILNILIHGVKKARERVNQPFAEFEKRKALYSDFADSLTKIISKTNRKLIIIIDELDRCRPTFAVQTLELVKHLFAVNGLVFIFALDVQQLSCAVRTIYGSDMDAPGYLCRFFDYLGKMPDPNRKEFIKLCLNEHNEFSLGNPERQTKVVDFLNAISKSFSLSLRDIATISKTYLAMFDTFLFRYEYFQFHDLYIFLLTLKYKKGSLYSNYLLHTVSELNALTETKKFMPDIPKNEFSVLSDQLGMINNSKILTGFEFTVYPSRIDIRNHEATYTSFYIETVQETRDKYGEVSLIISIRLKDTTGRGTYPGGSISLRRHEMLFDILEYNDVLDWTNIKGMSLGQYYFQQLEMFNFALPADEPATQS